MNYQTWREEVIKESGNWLTRMLRAKALPPALRQPERQVERIRPGRARLSWEQGPAGFINPFFKIPQQQNLYLLEQIPQLIPSVGSAMRILTQLVGCPKVESENKAAQEEAMEWWEKVNVNQTGTGGGVWFSGHVKDHLLYGRAHAEIIPRFSLTDIYALQELHPRTIEMRPRPEGYGVDLIQSLFFGLSQPLDRDLTLTTIHDYQQDNPHGCSIICNLPRVAEILNKMLQSLSNTWERFGMPTFVVIYKPAKEISDPEGTKGREVVSEAMTGLEAAVLAKANGETRDFGASGDFDIRILGAEGEALDIEVPGRLILEEITSVFGLPPWMLNKHWSTTERLSIEQAKLLGENITEIRQHLMPSIRYLFNLRQAFVGRPFEFEVTWDAPSLVDAQAEAQAEKTKWEALSANIKANREMWTLGAIKPEEFVRRTRPDLAEATDAKIREECPELLQMPPMVMSPLGGGGPGAQEEQPPREPVPLFGRSLTYAGSWGGQRKNGKGH